MLKHRQSRIRLEQAIVSHELPQFRLYDLGNDVYFEGWQATSSKFNRYRLKVVLPLWYPDDMPCLYISYPQVFYRQGYRGTINSEGTSHAFCTSANGPRGCIQICHSSQSDWDASKTCVGVLMKGILWLEAYETYLSTGRNIAEIMDIWKKEVSKKWHTKTIPSGNYRRI
jgi:hypothetical protein